MRRVRLEVRKNQLYSTVALLTLSLAAACSDSPLPPEPSTPSPAAVASVEITPDTVRLVVGATRTLSAVPRAVDGRALSNRPLAWRSGDESVARVDDSGNVTALKAGWVTIVAGSEGKEGVARIEVSAPPAPPAVAWVRIWGGGVELVPGQAVQLSATLHAADGTQLYEREVRWASADSTIARVGADGRVYALKGGTVAITASSEGKSSQVTVTVPAWVVYQVEHAAGSPLPLTLATSADTTERSATGTVVRERRVRLTQGRFYLSTMDRRYRQLYVLQTWQRTVSYSGGSAISDGEILVDEKVIRDEGEASELDPWTAEPIYRSATFAGHTFRTQWLTNGGRVVRQALPGERYEPMTFVFRR